MTTSTRSRQSRKMDETRVEEPKEEAPKRTRRVAPILDYTSLTVEAEAAPRKTYSAGLDNPFVQHLKDSWEERREVRKIEGEPRYLGGGRGITIPEANEVQVINLIRNAGAVLGVGTTVKTRPGNAAGTVRVSFAAKSPSKPRTRKSS